MSDAQQKHTPGEWRQSGSVMTVAGKRFSCVIRQGQTMVCRAYGNTEAEVIANTTRIVDCVNACANLNPAEIPGLVEAAELAFVGWKVGENIHGPLWALHAALGKVRGTT